MLKEIVIKQVIKRLEDFKDSHEIWDTKEYTQEDMFNEIDNIIHLLKGVVY